MRPTHRALAAATLATGAGAGLFALGQPGPGIALATAGLGTGLLVTEHSTSTARAGQASRGSIEALAALARGLALEGHAVLVPPGPGLPEPRCFLPAKSAAVEEVPPLDAATVVHRAPPGVLGLALPPPGLGLLHAWQEGRGAPKGGGVEEAAVHLREALPTLDLGGRVKVDRAGAQVRVRFQHALLGDLCTWTRGPGAPWHVQGMCPTCSLAHTLVAMAVGRPVRVLGAEGAGDAVALTLEVGPSSPV